MLAGVRDGDPATGKPILSVGGAGGPRIISATLQTIINVLDLEMPLKEAVAAARVHHQWSPDRLYVETALAEATRSQLAALGHRTEPVEGGIAVVQAVSREDGQWTGAADPRAPGGSAVSK